MILSSLSAAGMLPFFRSLRPSFQTASAAANRVRRRISSGPRKCSSALPPRSRFTAPILLAVFLGVITSAAAEPGQVQTSAALSNLDKRLASAKTDLRQLPPERAAGWRELRRKIPGIQVELDAISGAPRRPAG